MDDEVEALVRELRDLPGDVPVRQCTPCNEVSKVGARRRREIYDRLTALGSAAVPALARMLQGSLRGSDKDLTNTIFWILGRVHGPYFRDGNYGNNDISAALPVLMVALDDPTVRQQAASSIGAIGPKAVEAVPKLIAMLDDDNGDRGVQASACGGLKGIDPLPALRQARSDPNPEKQRFAQRAITSIETKCFRMWEAGVSSLETLARSGDLICKATTVADRSVRDDSLKPIDGFETREAELHVVSSLKGEPPNMIRFRYYSAIPEPPPQNPLYSPRIVTLLRTAIHYLSQTDRGPNSPFARFETGRTYLLVATHIAGDTYREVAAFLPSSDRRSFYSGPPPPYFGIMSPGVLLAADAKPHRGTTLTEAAWNELLALLRSPRGDDVLEAIQQLDEMSGGPAWQRTGRSIFERDEALVAIQPLVEAKSVDIATAAVTVFGGDSPYFYDQDAAFWFVGIGNGHITGLAARKRPANPVVAVIGAKELLQVATEGTTPKLRALAIRALGRSAQAYPAAMVAAWARDPSDEVRRAAVLASAEVPDREPIMRASTNDSPQLRSTAARAVGFSQDPHLLPLLDRLLHDPDADVRGAAALSLLSYAPGQAAPVMKANLTSDFRPLFVNALASREPKPYVAMLAEVIEQAQGKERPDQMEPTNWKYGGVIPAADSWRILFDFVKSRPVDELTSGEFDHSLDVLERMHWFGSGEPASLYELYVSHGMASRAKNFREMTRKSIPFDMDVYFDRIDRNPAYAR